MPVSLLVAEEQAFLERSVILIKGVKTINQYKIMQWINDNFINVNIKIMDHSAIKVIDCKGESALFSLDAVGRVVEVQPWEKI